MEEHFHDLAYVPQDGAMTETVLSKGGNTGLPRELQRTQVVLGWQQEGDDVDVDAAALLLTSARRVRTDADFVFYNQPESTDGSVRHLGRSGSDEGAQERVAVDFELLSPEVTTVAITASCAEGNFGALQGLHLMLLDAAGEPLVRYDINGATTETAFVFGELYRRGDGWKVRAVGQGWESGLAGLAQDFGVSVNDSVDAASPVAPDEEYGRNEGAGRALSASLDVVDVKFVPDAADSVAHTTLITSPDDDLVEVVESVAQQPIATVVENPALSAGTSPMAGELQAAPSSLVGTAADVTTPLSKPVTRRGVQTRKKPMIAAQAPAMRLAGEPTWQPARLFSVSGVGAAEEQEKRATSALLATMVGVQAFGRGIASRFGAPAGALETYLEVPFPMGERTVYPDGVIRIARGGRLWTGLLEVKTGAGQLRRDQVENYLDVARDQGFDAVITLSNDLSPTVGEHPVSVDKRKTRKVVLFHLSWAEALHEARMLASHRGVDNAVQAWVLGEFIRYLEHPRSGAAGFVDMGPSWVTVREAVAAGTLRASDRKVPGVADAWTRLVRHLCLRLTAELGVPVTHVLPRKLATDPAARLQSVITQLASDGVLEATLRVPGAVGPLVLTADLRTSQIRIRVDVAAPQEGTAHRRVAWLLRQLKTAPDDLLVELSFTGQQETTCECLRDVRATPAMLLPDRAAGVGSFRLTSTAAMGTKRSGVRGAFIPTLAAAVDAFYADVVQPLRPWTPPAPKLPEDLPAADGTIDAPQGTEEGTGANSDA